jgi:RNA polymerase sigma-70 factor (ECF subfamily)
MERYVDGDAHAFDELFRRYEKRAFAFFVRRTGSPDRAQDLYQELFLRIHRARGAYDASRAFAPWLFQIAHHLLIDDQRRAFRSREVSLGESEMPASRGGAPDAAADREQLVHLLGSLSESERWVFLSAKGEGVGYAELAARLGKSVDAVKKMASRTLQRLQRAALAESVAAS